MNNEELLDEVQEEEKPQESGPGELLANKREALGLGIQQVSEELHITMHYVRALESNAFEKLPAGVFVRGYIRSYADLLKLDPDLLINIYNVYTNHRESEAIEACHTYSKRRKNRNFPWIIISGIAFIAIAFALWYFSSGDDNATTSVTRAQNSGRQSASIPSVVPMSARNGAVTTIDDVTINLAGDSIAATTSVTAEPSGDAVNEMPQSAAFSQQAVESQQAQSAIDQNVTEPTSVTAQVTAQAPEEVTPASARVVAPVSSSQTSVLTDNASPTPTVQRADSTASPTGGTIISEPVDGRAADQADDVGNDAATSPLSQTSVPVNIFGLSGRVITVDAGGDDVIQISFTGQSMVQIDDRNDKQVYRDVRAAGDVLRLNGSAPFDILLGDASTADLSLNGNKVDFSNNIRIDNSARLTIGL